MKWDCKRGMMKKLLGLGIVLLALSAKGQMAQSITFTEFVKESHNAQKGIIRVQGDVNFGSNGIDNIFANKFAFGGHIESERISDIYSNMNKNGRVKVNLSYQVQYWGNDSLNKRKWNLFGGVGSRIYGQSTFNKDVFGMLFRGNKPYAGTTLDLNDTKGMLIQYMKYSIGLHREYRKDIGGLPKLSSYFGASLSYIQGIDYMNFETNQTSLFTEASGQYVDLDLQYNLERASRPKGLGNTQGHGVAIDAFYGKINKSIFWEASVSDLGVVSYGNLISYEKDTTGVRFEGQKIVAGGGSLSDVLDSIVDIVESKELEKSETVMLPAIFHFRVGKKISESLTTDAMLYYTLTRNNFPFLKARITKENGNSTYGASIGMGGFERSPIIGFHGSTKIMEKIYLQAQMAGIESYLVPSFFQSFQASAGIGVLL